MIGIIQLFLGAALGVSGLHMLAGGFSLVAVPAVFGDLILVLAGLTRSALWLASLRK